MKAVNLEKLLPADIPQGERVLWFGRPDPLNLWRAAYRANWVAAWFGVMTLVNFAGAAAGGLADGCVSALRTLGFGAAGLAILALLAWASARTTLYVFTERRVVIKTGIALPIFIHVPFKQIASAHLRVLADGAGDLTLGLTDGQRIPYLALWPSAAPLRFARPEPALRGIADVREVAARLGRALSEAAGQPVPAPAPASLASREPGRVATAAA